MKEAHHNHLARRSFFNLSRAAVSLLSSPFWRRLFRLLLRLRVLIWCQGSSFSTTRADDDESV